MASIDTSKVFNPDMYTGTSATDPTTGAFDASSYLDKLMRQQVGAATGTAGSAGRTNGGGVSSQATGKSATSDLGNGRFYTTEQLGEQYRQDAANISKINAAQSGTANPRTVAMLLAMEARTKAQQAEKEGQADRANMLAQLQHYSDSIGQQINVTMADLTQKANASNQQALNQIQARSAALGRTVSPWQLNNEAQRLQATANQQLLSSRAQLEQQADSSRQYVLSMMNNIYQNTQRQTMSPTEIAQLMTGLGEAAGQSASTGTAKGGGGSTVRRTSSSSGKAKSKSSGTLVDQALADIQKQQRYPQYNDFWTGVKSEPVTYREVA